MVGRVLELDGGSVLFRWWVGWLFLDGWWVRSSIQRVSDALGELINKSQLSGASAQKCSLKWQLSIGSSIHLSGNYREFSFLWSDPTIINHLCQ